MEDLPSTFLAIGLFVLVAIVLLRAGLTQGITSIRKYASMDELDWLKAVADNDKNEKYHVLITNVSNQVNLRIFKLIRKLCEYESLEDQFSHRYTEMIAAVGRARPSAGLSDGKFVANINEIHFDYTIFSIMRPDDEKAMRSLLKEIITGIQHLGTLKERLE